MSVDDRAAELEPAHLRYRCGTPEFGRIVNLSDGVFAIALTLLVLSLDVPDVPADQLGAALLAEGQQVVVFALSFGLIANIWWVHHKLVAELEAFDVFMIAMNFIVLGLVALAPFPTNLVGNTPTARAAVIPLLAVFLLISVAYLLMLVWVRRVGAWRRPPSDQLFRWLVIGWLGQLGGIGTAIVVAFWAPVGGLVIAALTGLTVGILVGVLGPSAYHAWKERPGV